MTDLVERLRELSQSQPWRHPLDRLAMAEAADEITRLQTRVTELEAALTKARAAIVHEYETADRLGKAEPDSDYREGVADGACDVMNDALPIIDAALQSVTKSGEQ